MGRVDLGFVRLHVGRELLQILGREVFPGEDQDRRAGGEPDRLKILDRIVLQIGIERGRGGVRAEMAHRDRVAVVLGALGAGDAGGPTGADHVFDHEGLAERLRHAVGDYAGDDVGRPARGERHNDGDGAGRIVLRRGGRDADGERNGAGQQAGYGS
jgi:hypothetical protein